MVGLNGSQSTFFGRAISGGAVTTIDDFSNPSVDLDFIKILDEGAWTSRADFAWSDLPLTNDVFSRNRLRGQP